MNQPTATPPDNWKQLVPQNRQGHWLITDAGCRSEPYINANNKWAVIVWNRREECHYEYEFDTEKFYWARKAWDNCGLFYYHKNDIVDLVERLVKEYET